MGRATETRAHRAFEPRSRRDTEIRSARTDSTRRLGRQCRPTMRVTKTGGNASHRRLALVFQPIFATRGRREAAGDAFSFYVSESSMFRAAIKLLFSQPLFFVFFIVLSRVECTIRTSPCVRPHAGPGVSRGFVTQRSPSIRARATSRGPQRLCSLDPDTSAAVPSLWRSRERDPDTDRTRSARETRRRRAPTRLSGSRPPAPRRS